MAESNAVEKLSLIKSKRNQTLGASVFTLIVILVMVVGAIRPSVATILEIREEIQQKEETLETLREKQRTLDGLRAQYDSNEDIFEALPLIYPNTGDFSLFMGNIEEVSLQNGFELTSISFDDNSTEFAQTYDVLQPIRVTILVRGDVENLIPFLNALESMPMYPGTLAVSYGTQVDDDGKINFNIDLVIYELEDDLFYE